MMKFLSASTSKNGYVSSAPKEEWKCALRISRELIQKYGVDVGRFNQDGKKHHEQRLRVAEELKEMTKTFHNLELGPPGLEKALKGYTYMVSGNTVHVLEKDVTKVRKLMKNNAFHVLVKGIRSIRLQARQGETRKIRAAVRNEGT
jgi:hypothetical protein